MLQELSEGQKYPHNFLARGLLLNLHQSPGLWLTWQRAGLLLKGEELPPNLTACLWLRRLLLSRRKKKVCWLVCWFFFPLEQEARRFVVFQAQNLIQPQLTFFAGKNMLLLPLD